MPSTNSAGIATPVPSPDEAERYRAATREQVQRQARRNTTPMGSQQTTIPRPGSSTAPVAPRKRPAKPTAAPRKRAAPAVAKPKTKPGSAQRKRVRPVAARPAPIAVVRRPQTRALISWTRIPKASYYNVIVWRDGQRVLDLWPVETRLILPTSWSYDGESRRLSPGRYLWFAYPGFGAPAEARYGEPVQSGVLVVERK